MRFLLVQLIGPCCYFVEDRMCAPKAEAHNFPVANIFPSVGEVVTTQAALKELE